MKPRFIADVNTEKGIVDYLVASGYDVKWIPDYDCTMTDQKIMLGKPIIKGTRLTVEIVVEKIAFGETVEDLQKDYPFLTEEDIRAALLYAARRVAHEEVFAA